jgi:putative Holliday junction resolvase
MRRSQLCSASLHSGPPTYDRPVPQAHQQHRAVMTDVRPGIQRAMRPERPPKLPPQLRPQMRPGVRLGVDVGSVRVGVSVSDPAAVLASPVETVRRVDDAAANRADLARIADLVAEHRAIEVVVGLPLSMSGARGLAAQTALSYARAIAAAIDPVPVRVVDERLSTVTAHGHLAAVGVGSRARRDVVDQAAAVIILQSALDAERSSGRAPGEVVTAP